LIGCIEAIGVIIDEHLLLERFGRISYCCVFEEILLEILLLLTLIAVREVFFGSNLGMYLLVDDRQKICDEENC